MPICIECCYPVPQLYHVLHSTHKPTKPPSPRAPLPNAGSKQPPAPAASAPATLNNGVSRGGGVSKAAGGDVRLTQCPRCKRFADKYVEHDYVVLFIDLVLVKPQVYRHLLFNRLGREDDAFDPSIKRLGILLLLFDVYLIWSSIENLPPERLVPSPIPDLPIFAQYSFYLLLCTFTTVAQHLTIRSIASTELFNGTTFATSPTPTPIPNTMPLNGNGNLNGSLNGNDGSVSSPVIGPTSTTNSVASPFPSSTSRPNAISTAIFVSSCMKLFPILMVVWKYEDIGGQLWRGVEWAVALQNLEALRILLGCSYIKAGVLVAAGAFSRWLVGRVILGLAGLNGVV